jgi:hypothetical protein
MNSNYDTFYVSDSLQIYVHILAMMHQIQFQVHYMQG